MAEKTGSPPRVLRHMLSLDDFEGAARRFLPRPIFGFVAGASESGAALRNNRDAFARWGFLPKMLRNVSGRTTTTTLFGKTYAAPFGIAPMGASALIAYRGDLALAEAAKAARIPMIISGSSLIRMEEIRAAYPDAWFQAYMPAEPERIEALLDRVEAAGFETLVVTVDTMVQSNREQNIRTGFSTPLRPSLRLFWDGMIRPRWSLGTFVTTLIRHGMPHFENSYALRGAPVFARTAIRERGARDHLDWEVLEGIRRRWKGTLIVKGLMTPADAARAAAIGAEGIIVSNHGGRQLDGAASPLDVLPLMRAAAPDVTLMLDSGVRRGTDVIKAFALGAEFVFVGRPFIYAAAIAGPAGVAHAIELLAKEVHRDLGLLGITGMGEVDMDLLCRFETQFPSPSPLNAAPAAGPEVGAAHPRTAARGRRQQEL